MRDDNQERDQGRTADPGAAAPATGAEAAAAAEDRLAAEREIRQGRAFDLATAVGRAGAGNLKGASPVPAARQTLLDAAALLAAQLPDAEGSLARSLLSRLEDDPALLDRHRDQPAQALAELLDRALATPATLAELVREADARWGRDYDERPRFEAGGRPPAADDPYTLDGVRALLAQLRRSL